MVTFEEKLSMVRVWPYCLLVAASLLVMPATVRAQPLLFDQQPIANLPIDYLAIFGDVNGDGSGDLLSGSEVNSQDGSDRRLRLLPGSGSASCFVSTAVWSHATEAMQVIVSGAFGDADGDGDLDLVLGGRGIVGYDPVSSLRIPAWMIRNDAGALGGFLDAQVIAPHANRRAIVLADLDGDGDLDLVSGVSFHAATRAEPGADPSLSEPDGCTVHLFDAASGAFRSTPTWTSATHYPTTEVIAADIDDDGDPDLLFCNEPDIYYSLHSFPNVTIFLNRRSEEPETIFRSEPDQELFIQDQGDQVELGGLSLADVDGDGDLDLIRPGDGVLAVHLNSHSEGSGTIFEESPAWDTLLPNSSGLGDLNGDGALDLVVVTQTVRRVAWINQGPPQIFGDTPDWVFESGPGTVTLLDGDGDGDLDLLFGSQLYRNLDPRLETAARATLLPAGATRAVILANVDDDGYPDLICGNDGTTRLHLGLPSVSGYFSPAVAWTPPYATHHTLALALGDVNGDSLPDIILGNRDEESLLFLGNGTAFGRSPAWSSPDADLYTTSLALGDVDLDGDPDLVFGNLNQPDQLYLNQGGDFGTEPRWSSAAATATRAIALGDVDGDGRLDLACGSDGDYTVLYRNTGAAFTTEPVWQTGQKRSTQAVALGDVDGDGLLDLACGNLGQRNAVYINRGGQLVEFPFWQSAESDSTLSIAFADVDADGWLDLVCGGRGGATCWYQNLGGTLSETATWRPAATRPTTAVALADLDKDGDLELVCGNDGQVPTVHPGRRNPLYQGDLTHPTNQTGNLPVAIRDVTVTRSEPNRYRIGFTVADAESDPAWLLLRWRYADGSGYVPLFGGQLQGPLATTPAGTPHELDWDATLSTFQKRPLVLELVSVEMPRTGGGIRRRMCYQHSLGTVEVRRAEVRADTSLFFPAVTLGDTVMTAFELRSTGNEPLEVGAIALPSTEMWLDGPSTFTVPAGETVTVTVRLGPRQSLEVDGPIVVESNAPLSPRLEIPVTAQVLPLAVKTRAVLAGETAPLGEALTILSVLETDVEGCTLQYRAGGAEAFTARTMERAGAWFQAVIPGQEVTERGLEFYVLMENSGVTATDPPGAPADSLYSVDVAAPIGLTVLPQPTSGSDYLAGREISLLVFLPEGSLFQEGWLYFRRGGETAWDSTAVVDAEPLPEAAIPDSVVGPRGVEYRLRVTTSAAELSYPALWPAVPPHVLPVKVTGLVEPAARPAGGYAPASVPLDFGADFSGTLATLLGSQPGYGAYDRTRWRCFRWSPAQERYLELGGEMAPELELAPGRSFWLISRQGGRLETGALPGWSVPTGAPFAVVLEPGWNQVANPYAFAVTWAGALVDGEPWTDGSVSPPYVRTAGGYVWGADIRLEPFSGFWVHNDGDGAVTVGIPPVEAAASAEGKATPASAPGNALSWSLDVSAACAGLRDGARAAIAAGAREGRDALDRPRPPTPPGRTVTVSLLSLEPDRRAGPLLQDVRDAAAGGWTWPLDVSKSFADQGIADEVSLRVDGTSALPSGLETVLLDLELGRSQDLRRQPELRFNSGVRPEATASGAARFRLVVGSADYVAGQVEALGQPPAATALLAPRPNPFNPAVMLRFELAGAQRARLRIYDAAGRLVRTLRDGAHEPGRYEAIWRGEDQRGRRVAAGVYFARLEADRDGAHVRKLTMLR